MLGKSGAMLAIVIACTACAATVSQDKATGEDGKQKGAKEMHFDNGESTVKGIVTYPGGDRVDWKFFETPDKKTGTVALKLTWKVPRPGLQLGMEVFDEWNRPMGSSTKTSKKRAKSAGRVRELTIANATGKYFVRVFAVGRGDAGAYTLTASFTEQDHGPVYDPSKIDVADPPRLPDVPAAEVPCDEFAFDAKNPACKKVCPKDGAPPNWPACAGQCPNPPDVNNPKCWDTMPCPSPMDRRVKSCKFPACPDPKNPDPNNPNCDNATVDPVTTRMLKVEMKDAVTITWGAGTTQGIGKGWTGVVLRGDSNDPLQGGTIKIVRVDKQFLIGTVTLTIDQANQNPRAKFSPPPRTH